VKLLIEKQEMQRVNRTGLLMLSAVPGVALGYLLLTGMLLRRIRPLPITFLPEPAAGRNAARREAVAA
jgi:hypothetical protein